MKKLFRHNGIMFTDDEMIARKLDFQRGIYQWFNVLTGQTGICTIFIATLTELEILLGFWGSDDWIFNHASVLPLYQLTKE